MTPKNCHVGGSAIGGAIGTRLADTGHVLAVFDLNAKRVQALVARGARQAGTATEAASVSDHVVNSLNSPNFVGAAVIDPDGVNDCA